MKLRELYTYTPNRRERQEALDEKLLKEHFESVKKAYAQAGLDITNLHECPGITTEEGKFQIELSATPQGEILGSHFLAHNPDKTWIKEGDIFMWNGSF